MNRTHGGFTLVELIASIIIMAVMASVVGLAYHKNNTARLPDELIAQSRAAHREALRLRKPVTLQIRSDSDVVLITAFPDGRVLCDADVCRQAESTEP